MITFEAYRGLKQECLRIAKQSAPIDKWEGNKVLEYSVVVGIAKEWDDFLKEQCEE
jgi:hypothetical protein